MYFLIYGSNIYFYSFHTIILKLSLIALEIKESVRDSITRNHQYMKWVTQLSTYSTHQAANATLSFAHGIVEGELGEEQIIGSYESS